MRLAKIATVSKFELLNTLCAGATVDSVIRLFLKFHTHLHMPMIWTVLNNRSLRKMRLVALPPVSNLQLQKTLCVGVTVDSILSPFFAFF